MIPQRVIHRVPLAILAVCLSLSLACSSLAAPVEADPPAAAAATSTASTVVLPVVSAATVTAPATPVPTEPPPATEPAPSAEHPVVPDATYTTQGDLTVIQIPVTDCSSVTATPIVVEDYLVMPMHDRGFGCEPRGAYANTLLGYHLGDGQLHILYEGPTGEATPLYVPEEGLLYWNVTFLGSVFVLDAHTFELVSRVDGLSVTSDASGIYLDGLFYFGTINTPEDNCQQPINPNCGGVYAADATGEVVHAVNVDDGFRSWIGAGLTTDGEAIYVGGSPQHLGDSDSEYLYGCSSVKFDADLNILAYADPGDPGCHSTGVSLNDEDAVAGEPVLGPDSVWVQYAHAPDDRNLATLIRYDRNLVEQCRVELEGGPIQVAAYYGTSTVDQDGNAYVPFTLPDGGPQDPSRRAVLLRVTPECEYTVLADLPDSRALASPTLADDQYVLFATDGRLGIYTLDGQLVREYALGSSAPVYAAPVIHEGVIYVLQADATLNIIENSGLEGYGNAYWPRYRHDNHGSGMAE